jgi:lipoprotein Spr
MPASWVSYLHGLAADIGVHKQSEYSLLASDISGNIEMHLKKYYDKRTECLLFACLLSLIFASCGTQHRTASTHQHPKVAQKDHESTGKNSHASASLGYYRQKFAPLIGVPASDINNVQLYSFIDSWMHAPYRYGGDSKQGVDCSNLSALLFREVYDKNISGSSATIFKETVPISKPDLKEGDCVFFKINTENVSHMGCLPRQS